MILLDLIFFTLSEVLKLLFFIILIVILGVIAAILGIYEYNKRVKLENNIKRVLGLLEGLEKMLESETFSKEKALEIVKDIKRTLQGPE